MNRTDRVNNAAEAAADAYRQADSDVQHRLVEKTLPWLKEQHRTALFLDGPDYGLGLKPLKLRP